MSEHLVYLRDHIVINYTKADRPVMTDNQEISHLTQNILVMKYNIQKTSRNYREYVH